MGAHCRQVDVEDPCWAELQALHRGTLFHSAAWARVLHDAYGLRTEVLLATDADGTVVGGMAVAPVVGLGGRRLVSVPFADACDPILCTPGAWPILREHLRGAGVPVLLRCTDSPGIVADPSLRVLSRARHHRLPLGDDPEKLHAEFSPACRRAIRKAERAGVEVVRPDDDTFLDAFLRLHVGLRKHKYGMLAQPRRFLEAIRDQLRAVDGWHPLLAVHDGRPVAATLYLRSGDTLAYKFNASDPSLLGVRPNNLLVWAGVQLGCELGCDALDFGASDDDQPGLIHFKASFGAGEGEITRLRWDPPGWDDGPERAAACALAEVTRLLADPRVPDEVTAEAGAALYRWFV